MRQWRACENTSHHEQIIRAHRYARWREYGGLHAATGMSSAGRLARQVCRVQPPTATATRGPPPANQLLGCCLLVTITAVRSQYTGNTRSVRARSTRSPSTTSFHVKLYFSFLVSTLAALFCSNKIIRILYINIVFFVRSFVYASRVRAVFKKTSRSRYGYPITSGALDTP